MADESTVAMFTAGDHMTSDQLRAVCDWLDSVGADHRIVRDAVVRLVDGGYQLTVTELVRDEQTGVRMHPVLPNEVLTHDRVIDLGCEQSWPVL